MHREPPVWREFAHLIEGLLAMESRLWRALTPTPEQATETLGGVTYD